MTVCDLGRWRLRWPPFKKLMWDVAVTAGGGEMLGVEEDMFVDGTDNPHDAWPLSAEVYVKCFLRGETFFWNCGADIPVGGWGVLVPTRVRLLGSSGSCFRMREVRG